MPGRCPYYRWQREYFEKLVKERLIALLFDDWEEDDGEVDSKKVSEVGNSEDIATSVCNGCSTCGSSGDVHVLMICL
jgi:hypothetical protein|nr:hypothetical protein [Zea mays]ACG40978.1 hypothetical protein [Zea mays]